MIPNTNLSHLLLVITNTYALEVVTKYLVATLSYIINELGYAESTQNHPM